MVLAKSEMYNFGSSSTAWAGSADYSVTAKLRASGVEFREDPVRFRNVRADTVRRADYAACGEHERSLRRW